MKRTRFASKALAGALSASLSVGMLPAMAFAQDAQDTQAASQAKGTRSVTRVDLQNTSGQCGDQLFWDLSDDGKQLSITGSGDMRDYISTIYPAPWNKQAASIETVQLPEGMTSIGSRAFEGTSSLKEVKLPSTLKKIGSNAFNGSSSLTRLEIPASVTSIGSSAFASASKLERVDFASGAASVGSNAFKSCNSLSRVVFRGNAPSIDSRAFSGVVANMYYLVGDPTWTADKRAQYGGTLQWEAYSNKVASVETSASSFVFNGEVQVPQITVKDELGDVLVLGTDYFPIYPEMSRDAGEYQISAIGEGAYQGSEAMASYKIEPASISSAVVQKVADQSYTGKAIEPRPSVSVKDVQLVAGKDFAYKYSNNTEVGDAVITMVGTGNYIDSIESSFKIVPARVDVPKPATGLVYNGKEQVGVSSGKGYSITGNVATGAGTYTAKLVLDKKHYAWADGSQADKAVSYTIAKAANPMKLLKRSKTLKAKALKTKAYKTKIRFAVKAKGGVTYKLGKKAKKAGLIVSKRGFVKVPKNTKKGIYGIAAKSPGDANYNPTKALFVIKVK